MNVLVYNVEQNTLADYSIEAASRRISILLVMLE